MAGWALQKFDEPDIDADSIAELRALLAEQEALLAEVTLPTGLRAMLQTQVESLKAALRLYTIRGASPLREAVQGAVGAMGTASTELCAEVDQATPEVKGVVERAMKIVGKAAELADKGSKIHKFGKEIYELGTQALHAGQGLLGYSPGP